MTVTFTISDACGNEASCSADIIIQDTEAPTITSCPADLVLECGDDYATNIDNWLAEAKALLESTSTDECENGPLTATNNYVSGTLPDVICPDENGGLTITFTVRDNCGNETSCDANITIRDTEAPTILDVPADLTVSCIEAVPEMEDLNWTDACTGDGLVSGVEVKDNEESPSLITRTWTFADACGNSTSVSQTIQIIEIDVTIDEVADLCVEDAPVILSALPIGGVFNGNGITGNQFDAAAAGAGTHEITYTYDDGNGCVESETININVIGLPVVSNLNVSCDDNGTPSNPTDDVFIIDLVVSNDNGGDGWVDNDGVTGNYGEGATFGPFSYDDGPVTLSFSDQTGLSCSTTITVDPPATKCSDQCLVDVDASVNGELACVDDVVDLVATSNITPATFAWTGPNGFNADGAQVTVSEPGLYVVVATNPINNCTATTEVYGWPSTRTNCGDGKPRPRGMFRR